MIILDEADDPHVPPKLASETSLSSRTVVRSTTPTPSLPDYEASQSNSPSSSASVDSHTPLQPRGEPKYNTWWPKRRDARIRRAILYILVIYFFLTVAVGVPVIVVKLRHKSYERQIVAQDTTALVTSTNLVIVDGDTPLIDAAASSCNAWTDVDMPSANLKRSDLEYRFTMSDTVFLQSNVSYYEENDLQQQVSGTVDIDINDDPTVEDAVVSVSMLYSDTDIRLNTSVCLMNISGNYGLYIYSPQYVPWPDLLTFNISLLFPQVQSSLYLPKLITVLPRMTQQFGFMDGYITFGHVELGGPMSKVDVGSLTAETAVIKSPLAEISGKFNISQALVLDTVSAPIDANISLYNNGSSQQVTYLELSTGNSPLSASITLHLPSSPAATKAANFLAKAETFNAPMNLTIVHSETSEPSVLRVHAENSLGSGQLAVDSKFSGTFDISTTYAEALVLMSDVLSQSPNGSQFDVGVYTPSSSVAAPAATDTRYVDFDLVSNSHLLGWVGEGLRPSASQNSQTGQGSIEMSSSLASLTLLLGS